MSAIRQNVPRYSDLIGRIDDLRAHAENNAAALVLGKIDGMSGLNSRYGYSIGDKVIEAFHEKLAGVAREQDLALEISSSSFAFVIHSPLHEGHVMLAADKIARFAEEWIELNETRMRLDISMGCALAQTPRDTTEDLLRQAESALQECRATEQRSVLYADSDHDTQGTSSHPMFDAHKAIENGEFRVFFQPQFDLATRQLAGAEALVRWSGPDGLQSPGSFMNELERARSMIPLLQFVTNNTSREMSRWVRLVPNMQVAINSSAADLEDTDLVEIMSDVLSMWNLDAAHLKLEITETSLMRNPEKAIETLRQLQELGIHTSIDDFGTGYSSLSWLKNLPVDELKIDRSFVQTVLSDAKDRKIVESIVSLAHAMGLKVVAEGIESEGIMHVIRETGCDIGQGYFFGQPVSSADFERCWLAEHAHG